MLHTPSTKYRAFAPIDLGDRSWPSRLITAPPQWVAASTCATATKRLIEPMDARASAAHVRHVAEKLASRKSKSVSPQLSQTDFDFVREVSSNA